MIILTGFLQWENPEPLHQPGRGSSIRRSCASGHPQRGHELCHPRCPPRRRSPALPRHRDSWRSDDKAGREELKDSLQATADVHYLLRQPVSCHYPGKHSRQSWLPVQRNTYSG